MLPTLTNTAIGYPFIMLNMVDSTNNYAMEQVKNKLTSHGTAYFASEQTAGKGQRNKQWLSSKNENIILSIVLEVNNRILLSQQFYLNVIAALAAFELFNNYTTNNLKIKWPNDMYWQDRKTGGILIENIISGTTLKYAVVGFGLNVNQTMFDASLKNPVSLKQITNKSYDIIMLANELCLIFNNKYDRLINGDLEMLLKEYNMHLYKKNSIIKLKKNSKVFEAYVIKVDETGKLIVKTSIEESLEFGSVEWIIK